jgi:antitoxin CptB
MQSIKKHHGPKLRGYMEQDIRIKRLKFRAWHRGTKEADLMIGGFFDARHSGWTDDEINWFEGFLEEQDVDIMGWALGTIAIPTQWQGPMMDDLKRLDFIEVSR